MKSPAKQGIILIKSGNKDVYPAGVGGPKVMYC